MGIQRRGHVSPGWPEPYVSVAIGTDANPPSPRPKSPETTAVDRMVADGETTSGAPHALTIARQSARAGSGGRGRWQNGRGRQLGYHRDDGETAALFEECLKGTRAAYVRVQHLARGAVSIQCREAFQAAENVRSSGVRISLRCLVPSS
jgi:hypothetical protein